MNTPVYDFVREYAASGTVRAHMPGHKGRGPLGCEALDLTEIAGADSLYEDDGILLQSEQNAAALFGAGKTLYSAEGSSLCIRTMLYLAQLRRPDRPWILAARNAHKVFLQTCMLLGLDITWLWDESESFSLCRAAVSAAQVDSVLRANKVHPPIAVHLTTPDYLGNENDVAAIAETAHRYGVPLLVDNAHGAYLKFLPESRHPMDCGADMCCDSAHKTFPVLTGGAYLHIGRQAPAEFGLLGKQAMAQFGSTSPSYLILASLDANNAVLASSYPRDLAIWIQNMNRARTDLAAQGWSVLSTDPLKLTIEPGSRGYRGTELADLLRKAGVECEYADPDDVVMMLTPCNLLEDLAHIVRFLGQLPERTPVVRPNLRLPPPETVCTPRYCLTAPREQIPAAKAEGRILAAPTMSCPPAVPAVVCGERISAEAVQVLTYYGTSSVWVLK